YLGKLFLCEIHKSTILLYLLFLFYKSKEIRRLSFYLNSDTLFETVSTFSKKIIKKIHQQVHPECLYGDENTKIPIGASRGPLMGIELHSVLNADRSTAVLDVNRRPLGKLLH
ncbi:MAG: hypothetical protein PUH74_01680, partial [Bacteroidales bacterium]|nr:hypothetical protein [Bacteroidales bacterium]